MDTWPPLGRLGTSGPGQGLITLHLGSKAARSATHPRPWAQTDPGIYKVWVQARFDFLTHATLRHLHTYIAMIIERLELKNELGQLIHRSFPPFIYSCLLVHCFTFNTMSTPCRHSLRLGAHLLRSLSLIEEQALMTTQARDVDVEENEERSDD